MSSMYRVLCLSHDPAIQVGPDFHHHEVAVDAVRDPQDQEGLAEHVGCDLLVGEYSYPLVEVCCVRCKPGAQIRHLGPQWVDVEWLRLLAAALDVKDAGVQTAVEGVVRMGCWSRQRVERLRGEL